MKKHIQIFNIIKHKIKCTLFFKNELQCSVCNNMVFNYVPISNSYKNKIINSGYQFFGMNEHTNVASYSCPICKAADRDRLYAEYFKNIIKIKRKSSYSLLHIAPSWSLNNFFLKKYFNITTCDLLMKNVDYNLNIEDMNDFDDNSFDFVICSHVLEHVQNTGLALSEISRVLQYKGKAIIMAPIIPSLKNTIEDSKHITKEQRMKYYGQDDHLRLFSKNDFVNRIKNANLTVEMLNVENFTEKRFNILGIKDSSVLYIGNKY